MPGYSRAILIAAVAFVAAVGSAGASHALDAEQRCDVAKLKATGEAVGRTLRCQGRAAGKGLAPDAACGATASDKLVAAFAKAESRGGCAVTGNATIVADTIASTTDQITFALAPTPTVSQCAAIKLRVTSGALPRVLACHTRAVRHASTLDESCVAAATERLSRVFARLDAKQACLTEGDAASIAAALATAANALEAFARTGLPPDDAAPSALSAVVAGAAVELSWVNPDSMSGNTHVKLLRRLNTPPSGPTDVAADVVFFGTASSADDDLTALLPSTTSVPRTYHYAVFGCTSGDVCETTGSRTTVAPTVSEALHAGGYVVHWRHAAADVCADRLDLGTAATTSVPDWWKSCDAQCPPGGGATARQMNAFGVTQSVSIGDAFRARDFPVGRVISSEFCRNVGTAELMAFPPVIEESPLITYFVYVESQRCQNSYAFLSEPPAPGTNTVLIGHAGFTCAVLDSLAWGEGAIFKPDGAGGTLLIARVLWDGWMSLP